MCCHLHACFYRVPAGVCFRSAGLQQQPFAPRSPQQVGLQQTAATEAPQTAAAAPAEAINRTTTLAAAWDRLAGHQHTFKGVSKTGTTLQQQQLREVWDLLQHIRT
jgi:hypothetical protein